MRGALLFAGLIVASTTPRAAEPETEQPTAAFLQYLGTLEADVDNWTLLTHGDDDAAEAADQGSASKDVSAATPVEPGDAGQDAAEGDKSEQNTGQDHKAGKAHQDAMLDRKASNSDQNAALDDKARKSNSEAAMVAKARKSNPAAAQR